MNETERQTPPGRTDTRLLAALAYVPGLCILTLLLDNGDPFARHHARQGLVLLFVELVAAVAIAVLDSSIGRLPLLGPVLVGLLKLVAGLGLLALAAVGAARAAMGERWRMPYVAQYADRLSI